MFIYNADGELVRDGEERPVRRPADAPAPCAMCPRARIGPLSPINRYVLFRYNTAKRFGPSQRDLSDNWMMERWHLLADFEEEVSREKAELAAKKAAKE